MCVCGVYICVCVCVCWHVYIFIYYSQFPLPPLFPVLPPSFPSSQPPAICSSVRVRSLMVSQQILSHHVEAGPRPSPPRVISSQEMGSPKPDHSLGIGPGSTSNGPTNCPSHPLSSAFRGPRSVLCSFPSCQSQ